MPSPHQRNTKNLSPSLEHYLRAIYDLQLEKGYARVTDIAESLGVAKPAVSTALRTLRTSGLVDHRVYESVLLTDEGTQRARNVSGKFSIMLHFLMNILGVEEEQAFVDACLMEHYVSAHSLDRFLDLLRFFENEENNDVLESFHHFRRSCESENTCPTCSFHCDVSVASIEVPERKKDTDNQ